MKSLASRRLFTDPMGLYRQQRQTLDMLSRALETSLDKKLSAGCSAFETLAARLDALSPLAVLTRGYAVATRGGRVIRSVSEVEDGTPFFLRLSDGEIMAKKLETDGENAI